MSKIILGISAFYHDSAATIIKDGEIIAAVQEERFTRKKGDNSFPHHAINYCLDCLNITINEVDYVVYYENYLKKFARLLINYHATVPFGITSYLKSMPKQLTQDLFLEAKINKELGVKMPIIFCDHHMAHAASAFYPSNFQQAAILTIDGVGEFSSTTIGIGKDNQIKLLKEITYPNSVGLLYSAFTYFTGFKINSGEYKMMGLAPYGKPKYVKLIKDKLIHINEDGSIILNQKYFNYTKGLTMTNRNFEKLFNIKRRKPETKITQDIMDLACSIQQVTDEIILKMAKYVKKITKLDNLVLAGGVSLNVVSMGKLQKSKIFKNIWIQPAGSDAGASLGAALWYYYSILKEDRTVNLNDSMQYAYLGPMINNTSKLDDKILKKFQAKYTVYDEDTLAKKVAQLLNDGKIVAIARGRSEFGPRALGNRSILGSAIDENMQVKMNLKVKKRESFRPFAPIVLESDAKKYFDMDTKSLYMLMTYYVKKEHRLKTPQIKNDNMLDIIKQKRSIIPAVTHIDYSSRVQTINQKQYKFIYDVLKNYKKLSGIGLLINTSFNVRGEPIVNNVIDAYKCFMNTDIDYLVIGNRLFKKDEQKNYKGKVVKFKLD